MSEPSRLALFRYWLGQHDIVPVVALISIVLALGFGAFFMPLGPPEHLVGTVQEVKIGHSKSANDRVLYVDLASRVVVVSVPPGVCAVGDPILLERQRKLWGYSIIVDPLACSRPVQPDRSG